jgi:rhodanese-related sulfurtransferase
MSPIKTTILKVLALLTYCLLAGYVTATYKEEQTTPTQTTTKYTELKESIQASNNNVVVLDARSQVQYEMGAIPNAINLPLTEFEKQWKKIGKQLLASKKIIVYCSSYTCNDSEKLAEKLKNKGVKVVEVYKGGYEEWTALQQLE